MRRIVSLVFVAAVGLGGCSSTLSETPIPGPTATPSGLSVATQRSEAQAGIAVAQGIQVASLLTAVLHQLPLGGGTLPTGACKDGVESTVKVLNPEQLLVTIDIFYDATCKTILTRGQLKTTYFPGGHLEIAGTSTAFDIRGHAVAFATIASDGTALPTGAHLVTTGTVSRTPTGPAQLAFGLTCTLAAKNDCGFGGVFAVSSLSQSFGATVTLDGFTGSGPASGTVAVKGYGAALGKLKLKAGAGDTWKILGGTLLASTAGTFDEDVNAKSLDVTGTLDLKDTAANARVTLGFGTRTGIAKGIVESIAPASPYASFSTVATGTGSIAYSSGPAGQILFFIITS